LSRCCAAVANGHVNTQNDETAGETRCPPFLPSRHHEKTVIAIESTLWSVVRQPARNCRVRGALARADPLAPEGQASRVTRPCVIPVALAAVGGATDGPSLVLSCGHDGPAGVDPLEPVHRGITQVPALSSGAPASPASPANGLTR